MNRLWFFNCLCYAIASGLPGTLTLGLLQGCTSSDRNEPNDASDFSLGLATVDQIIDLG